MQSALAGKHHRYSGNPTTMSSPWEAISAICSVIQTIVVVITIRFAVLQIKQANQNQKLEVSIRLFDELSSPSARKNRAFIYLLSSKHLAELTTEEFLIIDEVLSSFDRAWILIESGQIDRSFVYEAYGEIFLKVWGVTQSIIMHERRGRRGYYYRQRTETLVENVKDYFRMQNKPLEYPV